MINVSETSENGQQKQKIRVVLLLFIPQHNTNRSFRRTIQFLWRFLLFYLPIERATAHTVTAANQCRTRVQQIQTSVPNQNTTRRNVRLVMNTTAPPCRTGAPIRLSVARTQAAFPLHRNGQRRDGEELALMRKRKIVGNIASTFQRQYSRSYRECFHSYLARMSRCICAAHDLRSIGIFGDIGELKKETEQM